jgi:hypothetical protein
MNSNIKLWIAVVVVGIIAVGGYFYPQVKGSFSSTGTRLPNGVSADSTSPTAGQLRGTTLLTTGAVTMGGNLTVTTSNTATSTLAVGCIQSYATSTATAVRLTFSTFAGTTTSQGGNSNFLVAAQYGSCPI